MKNYSHRRLKSMHGKRTLPILVIAMVIVVIAIGVAYFVVRQSKPTIATPTQPTRSTQPIKPTQTEPTTTPTRATFTNPVFPVSISYPHELGGSASYPYRNLEISAPANYTSISLTSVYSSGTKFNDGKLVMKISQCSSLPRTKNDTLVTIHSFQFSKSVVTEPIDKDSQQNYVETYNTIQDNLCYQVKLSVGIGSTSAPLKFDHEKALTALRQTLDTIQFQPLSTWQTTQVDFFPIEVGQCQRTTVASIGTRFTNSPDSGSQITYQNAGRQVYYDTVPEIVHAQVGDPINFCLATVPDPADCPPGDDRGRNYTTENLRTKEKWAGSPDAHLCGGA